MKIPGNFSVKILAKLQGTTMGHLAFVCNASGSTPTPTIEIKPNR